MSYSMSVLNYENELFLIIGPQKKYKQLEYSLANKWINYSINTRIKILQIQQKNIEDSDNYKTDKHENYQIGFLNG